MRLTLLHKGLLLVSIPLCFEMVFFSYLMYLQNQVEAETKRVNHLLKVDELANKTVRELIAIAMQIGEYGSLGMHASEISARRETIRRQVLEMRELTKGEPHTLELLNNSAHWLDQADKEMKLTRVKVLTADPQDVPDLLKQGAHRMDNDLLQAMGSGLLQLSAECARELDQDKTSEQRRYIMIVLKIAMAVSVLVGILGASFLSRHLVGRLSRVRANAQKLAAGKPLLVPLAGGDEIAQLDHSFHWAAELIDQNLRKEKAILSNTRDLICSFDDRFKIKSINPAGESLLGQEEGVLVGRSFLSLIAEGERKNLEEALQQLATKASAAELAATLMAEGERPIQVDISVGYSPKDKTYYAVVHDVTLKRQLEQVKQEVTAMITHDLRTPLQAVRNYFEMLRSGRLGELNEKGQRLLSLSEQSSMRMTRLIESVLHLEKLRSGTVALDKKPVNLLGVLQKSVEAVQLIAADKSITFSLEPLSVVVMGDEAWLEQVFVNIFANAINYSPANSQVQARVQVRSEKGGDFAEVRVRDQGPGISPEEQALIFDRFHRVSASAQKVTGSGLGLTICKELVDLHKGYIKVESEPGRGSTFIIGIPCRVGA